MISVVNGINRTKYLFLTGMMCILIISGGYSQEQKPRFNNQITINASKFIKGIFPGQEYEYEIGYRRVLNHKFCLRTAFSYYNQTTDDGYFEGGLRLGSDYTFRDFKNWKFYFGLDVLGNYISYRSSQRENYQVGIIGFLGVTFKIGDHFSLSTEPGIYGIFNHYKDRDSFSEYNIEEYYTFGLGNIGQIILGFHF